MKSADLISWAYVAGVLQLREGEDLLVAARRALYDTRRGALVREVAAIILDANRAGIAAATTLCLKRDDVRAVEACPGCEAAWGVIANAHGGDWKQGSPEWQKVAALWRDAWLSRG